MAFFEKLFKRSRKTEKESKETPAKSDIVTQPLDMNYAAGTDAEQVASPDTQEPLKTRPLPPQRTFASAKRRIRYGQGSDTGMVRSNNQDACLSLMANPEMEGTPPPIGFFVVADGMGGHRNGEVASAKAVQTLAQHVLKEIIMPHLDDRELSSDQKTIPEVLADAMLDANEAVLSRVTDGGTTATCAVIRGDLTYVAHVGDSRAYLISDGKLELITRDHSLVKRLQELGQLTEAEAEIHPQRNVLYRALGQSDTLEVDAATRRLPPSSYLLLCSDGLWGVLSEEQILKTIEDTADAQEACDVMIKQANTLGGPDNITAVLIQMPE